MRSAEDRVPNTLPPPRAVCFDLLTALLDSWTLWDACAGGPAAGRAWRLAYLRHTYGAGDYVPYEQLVARAAVEVGVPPACGDALLARWDTMAPWPDVPATLRALPAGVPLGVVTNCSITLGRRAATLVEQAAGRSFAVVTTAEEAGAYKPDARPYRRALAALGLPAAEVLFVAGSPADLGGAAAVGMPVAWHNAAGLPRRDAHPVPRIEARTLRETLAPWFPS
jgi:2-haloalkanoic acid dehalogenase type II